VDSFIQCAGAPNLYWALSDLPRPFAGLRGALQGERVMLYCTFPGLGTAATDRDMGPLNSDDARACVKAALELRQLASLFEGKSPLDSPRLSKELDGLLPEEFQKPLERWEESSRERMHFARLLLRHHAEAKRALIASGRPRDRVEAMPFIQVAVLHGLQEYDRLADDFRKWEVFPYWESRPQLRRLRAQAEQEVKGTREARVFPASVLVLPVGTVFQGRAWLDRKIAALRCVEAVRLYAAAHHGRLPATLGAIQEVPIPRDPMTGKEFEYHVEEDRARLYGPPPEGEKPNAGNSLSYELTLRR
jgi:hypothetical protein